MYAFRLPLRKWRLLKNILGNPQKVNAFPEGFKELGLAGNTYMKDSPPVFCFSSRLVKLDMTSSRLSEISRLPLPNTLETLKIALLKIDFPVGYAWPPLKRLDVNRISKLGELFGISDAEREMYRKMIPGVYVGDVHVFGL